MFGMSEHPPQAKRKVKPAAASRTQPSPGPQAEDASVDVSVPLTPAQHAKLEKLGGVKWILAQLEKAKPPGAA